MSLVNKYLIIVAFFASNTIRGVFLQDDDKLGIKIRIKNGELVGRELKTVNTGQTYYGFQGIPFALPPVGDLRFKDPVPTKNWNGTLNATKDGNICFQGLIPEGSEDCLYINVFTPQVSTANLSVMVWIYGGYFLAGDSQFKNFGPDYLLEQNVVVVTFNYRLGIFGFFSTGDSVAPGNYALKDQILALKWVQDNIAHFGGDKNSVTLFGESAGSACVSYLIQTPLTKGLFHRAIMQSGTSLSLWSLSRNPRKIAFQVGNFFGVFTNNSETLVDGLRKADAAKLQLVSTSKNLLDSLTMNLRNGLIFAPTIEPPLEGAVVTKFSHEALKTGNFNQVPVIVGYNSQEGIPFVEVLNYLRVYLLRYDAIPTDLIPIDMNLNENFILTDIVALDIKHKYFGIIPVTLSNNHLIQFISDDQFVRPTNEYVKLHSKFAPTYFYRFSYEGNLGSPDRNKGTEGVAHGEDLHYLWNSDENIQNASDADLLTRQRLLKLWTNFAKTSNPTPHPDNNDNSLGNIIWLSSNRKNYTCLDIGINLQVIINPNEKAVSYWNSLYKTYGNEPYDTY